MFRGIPAAENDRLQAKANAVVRRLFRRRVKQPGKLLEAFRAALQHEGFVRVNLFPVSSNGDMGFKALLGKKLKAWLDGLKHLRKDDAVYGHVIRAGRRCGLDPRIEEVSVCLRGNRVERYASAVPFVVQTRALDKAMGLM